MVTAGFKPPCSERIPRKTLLALILGSLIPLIAVIEAPAQVRTVAVVYPPWWGETGVMEAAVSTGARLAGKGAVGFVVVVDRGQAGSGLLRQSGALFQIDARMLTCGPQSRTS